MTIFDKIRIRKRLRSKSIIRVVLDHYIIKKDFIDYYFKMLPKYGFKLISLNFNGLHGHRVSLWCHPKRASKNMVYKSDITLYADNSVISDSSKRPMCEGCVHFNKCHEGGNYLNGRR